jgi:hypothetical protein
MIFTLMAVAESAHIALAYRITIGQNRGDTSAPTTAGASLFAPALACPLTALPVIATHPQTARCA